MKKLMTVMATVALVLAGRADLMTYAPQGGENLWSDTSAWRIGGEAAGRVPMETDNVQIDDPALDAAHPLTVAEGTSVKVGTFALSNTSSSATSPLTFRLAENATLDVTSTETSYIGARSSMGSVALVQETGSLLSVKNLLMGWNGGYDSSWIIATGATVTASAQMELGRTDGAYCHVTNHGVVTLNGLHVGSQNGCTVDFENFGVVTNLGTTRICNSRGNAKRLNQGTLHVNPGASMVQKDDDLTIGADGRGVLDVEGGMFLDVNTTLQLGLSSYTYDFKDDDIKHAVGTLRIHGDGVVSTNVPKCGVAISAGCKDGASGHIILTDNGKLALYGWSSHSIIFGDGKESVGTLTLSNNASFAITKNLGIQFAKGASSRAKLVMADQTLVTSATDNTFASGSNSVAEVNLSGSAVLNADGGSQAFASGQDSSVKVTLADSAKMQWKGSMKVGAGVGSKSDIRLRGGKIAFQTHSSTLRYLTLGSPDSEVRLSGWGAIERSGTTTYTANRSFNLDLCGLVIADGEGQPRMLDFNIMGRVNGADEVTVLNACGTNGWYAVNGGCVALPSYWPVDATTYCVGDFRGLSRPNVVNAFTVAMTGAATGKYLHGSLYAPEHEDVPAGLPAEKHLRPIGIWRIGYGGSTGVEPGKAVAFTSADVTMRVGLALSGIKPNRKVTIRPWRYDMAQGAWVGGESTEFDPESPYVTFANVEPCVAAGTTGWNLGWFAVTADDSVGLVLLVK